MELQSICSWRPFSNFHSHPVLVLGQKNQPQTWTDQSIVRLQRRNANLGFRVFASSSNSMKKLEGNGAKLEGNGAAAAAASKRFDIPGPYGGKSGSVSFNGLNHQVMEEKKLVSSPLKDDKGSLVWVLAPVALISSLVLPQFFLSGAVDAFLKDEILAEIVISISSEVIFYSGLAAFLLVTDRVQKPYLEYSVKQWGLITGLKGYLNSIFFTMGVKVIVPLLAVLMTWPVLGLPAIIAVFPFLAGCAVQFAFEVYLDRRGSSCWPLVPIIFEVYRLYQLTKAAHFIEKLMFIMKGATVTPEVIDRTGALISMLVSFQALSLICLWSLVTFLLRLFPSRPVAENY